MAKIRLNRKFYDKKNIDLALGDFREICDGRILNRKFEVELNPKGDIENLEDEFCNYVLGLIKNN